jgi:type VI secretion system secreted protein VgrG
MSTKLKQAKYMAGAALVLLLGAPTMGFAQIPLGAAETFAVLAATTVTNTSATTTITGDVGVSPGTEIVGLPAGQPIGGSIYAGDTVAAQAQADLGIAYGALAAMPCTTPMSGVDLGAQTLTPGVYCFAAAAGMTGVLTLDAQGDPNAEFVFQISSALSVAGGASMVLTNGAQASNVASRQFGHTRGRVGDGRQHPRLHEHLV